MTSIDNFFLPFGNLWSLFKHRAKGVYRYGWDVINASTQFNNFADDQHKLAMVLSNPAVMKVFSLQCDLFSMGKVTVEKSIGKKVKVIEDDPFLDLIRNPNPFTSTESQFLWDFMFWNMMGTSYCYVDSKDVTKELNKMYFLDPGKIIWPKDFWVKKDKLVFSEAEVKNILKTTITYRYADGTTFSFPLDRLVMCHDLTNSAGNFFKGPSRLDALCKIISNSEYTLDADNINIRYSGKFLVGSDKAVGTSIKVGMSQEEKDDIEKKVDTDTKSVWPLQSMVNIQRFVSDMANLQLSEKYLHLYFVVGNMYGIPRDVLEAYNSATYENQEKARAAHVNYCLEPKGEQFMDGFEVHFKYREAKKKINIGWDHLPFVQIFAKEKAETKKILIENLTSLLALGVDIEQANEFLETEFEIKEETAPANGQGQTIPPGGQSQVEEAPAPQGEDLAGQPVDKKIIAIR